MLNKKFNLVFEGRIAVVERIKEVKNNLRVLTKATPEQIESLFVSGKQTIIKRNLDYEQAIKHKEAFEKTGALCSIVEMSESKPASSTTSQNSTTADGAPANAPIKITTPRAFYVELPYKLLISATPVLMILMTFFLPFNFSQLPIEGVIVLSSAFFLVFALMLLLVWRFWKPGLILSEQGLEYTLANPFKPLSVKWSQIHGIVIEERLTNRKIQTTARLSLASDSKGTKEMAISLAALEGSEEALAILKQMIPEKKSRDFSNTLQRFKPVTTDTIKYRDIEIGREGIVTTSKVGGNRIAVPWNRIVGISTESLVIAGYGSVTVQYLDGEITRKLLIRASMSETYQDCVKLLIANAKEATLDPGVIAILEYPISSAKADFYAIILLCTGVIFAIGGLIILSFYPPTVASTWLYPLLLLPFVLAPLAWTVKLISSRFKGDGVEPFRKFLAASLCNIGTLLSIATLFSLSPSSFIWLLADTNTLLGRLDAAEAYYIKAEADLSGNEDFIFTLGQFYSRKKEWDKASRYYIRAYEKDPTNWMPQPLMQIPNSLCMAGKYEEALQWCDRIQKEYSERREIVRRIEKKRKEIKSRMPTASIK